MLPLELEFEVVSEVSGVGVGIGVAVGVGTTSGVLLTTGSVTTGVLLVWLSLAASLSLEPPQAVRDRARERVSPYMRTFFIMVSSHADFFKIISCWKHLVNGCSEGGCAW